MPRSTELAQRMPTILEDAKQRIQAGETLQQVADANNIPKRTLINWLSALGPEYQAMQQVWVDSMLSDAADEIENVERPYTKDDVPVSTWHLTRARHAWERATFYAERRDKRYQVKQEAQVTVLPVFTMILDQGGVNVHRLEQGSVGGDIYASPQIQSIVDTVPSIEKESDTGDTSEVQNPPSQSEG